MEGNHIDKTCKALGSRILISLVFFNWAVISVNSVLCSIFDSSGGSRDATTAFVVSSLMPVTFSRTNRNDYETSATPVRIIKLNHLFYVDRSILVRRRSRIFLIYDSLRNCNCDCRETLSNRAETFARSSFTTICNFVAVYYHREILSPFTFSFTPIVDEKQVPSRFHDQPRAHRSYLRYAILVLQKR